eukprot:Hpha_TRINITY_DN19998_c0_g1::TRINITY_DN19998_c0_g1_i1::g.93492::m.93492
MSINVQKHVLRRDLVDSTKRIAFAARQGPNQVLKLLEEFRSEQRKLKAPAVSSALFRSAKLALSDDMIRYLSSQVRRQRSCDAQSVNAAIYGLRGRVGSEVRNLVRAVAGLVSRSEGRVVR